MAVLGGILRLRAIAPRRSRVVPIATSILGTQVVTSLLGLAYWTVAARGLAPALVGQLGSATAAAMVLGGFGVLGCGTLLVSRLGGLPAERRRVFLVAALVVSLTGGCVLGVLFGLTGWLFLPAFGFLSPVKPVFWSLVVTSGLTATGGVFDQVMLVVGRPLLQVVRNGVSSGTKVLLLAGLLVTGHHGVAYCLAAWAIGQFLGCAMALAAAFRLLPAPEPVTATSLRRVVARYWRDAATHHGVNVSLAAPSMVQPVIIAAMISAELNATFTAVRLVGMMTFMAPYALAMALFASSASDTGDFERRSRLVLVSSLGLSLSLCLATQVAAPMVLGVFGHAYSVQGAHYLRIMALAGPLLVFKDQYIARARTRGLLPRAMPYVVGSTALELGGTLAGAFRADLNGALIGWLVALGAGAAWVYQRRRGERGTQVEVDQG